MAKKIPTRQCIGCREVKPKNQLVRVNFSKISGASVSDPTIKDGRGAYICKDEKCLEMAIKKNGLEKSFKGSVPKEIYETLKNELLNDN